MAKFEWMCKIVRKNQYAPFMHKQISLIITQGNNSNRIGPSPLFFYYKYYQCVYKVDEILSLPVQDIEKPKCRGQTNGRKDSMHYPCINKIH